MHFLLLDAYFVSASRLWSQAQGSVSDGADAADAKAEHLPVALEPLLIAVAKRACGAVQT